MPDEEPFCLTCGAPVVAIDWFTSWSGLTISVERCPNGHEQEMEAPPDEQG